MSQAFDQLRLLAVADPRAARELLVSLLDSGSVEVRPLFQRLSAPGEGRLRQLVANAVRSRADKDKAVPYLLQWAETETDEFARAAIAAALRDVDRSRHREPSAAPAITTATPPERLPDLVDTYHYVAGRLCHRVRNALPGSSVQVRRIEALVQDASEPLRGELLATLGNLKDAIRAVARVVEFETGDNYFEWKGVAICSWLVSFTKSYNLRNDCVTINFIVSRGAENSQIRANEHLLETVFWNLWKNSSQAVGDPCLITATVENRDARLILILSDNGDGIPDDLIGVAFEESFSTNGRGRGRGLLEVQDAVRRLSGTVSLAPRRAGGNAVVLSFPLEGA